MAYSIRVMVQITTIVVNARVQLDTIMYSNTTENITMNTVNCALLDHFLQPMGQLFAHCVGLEPTAHQQDYHNVVCAALGNIPIHQDPK